MRLPRIQDGMAGRLRFDGISDGQLQRCTAALFGLASLTVSFTCIIEVRRSKFGREARVHAGSEAFVHL